MKANLFICSFLFLLSCSEEKKETLSFPFSPQGKNLVTHAKRFAMYISGTGKLVYVFGNKNNSDTTQTFFLTQHPLDNIPARKNFRVVYIPCRRVVALSSIYANMLCELNCLDRLKAVDNMDYISNVKIIEKFQNGGIVELAKSPELNIENTLKIGTDMILTYGMGNGQDPMNKKMEDLNLPVAVMYDHLEETPLARAEWIKFVAAFIGPQDCPCINDISYSWEELAEDIFSSVEKNYNQLKRIAGEYKYRPTVFTETKFGDFWYVPGGKSNTATLLNDAGADYIWNNENTERSIPKSFEEVYTKAKDADFWMNLSSFKNKKELLASEKRYGFFKAFKNGNLYNNNLHLNSNGYCDYWETGTIYPDRILSDLIKILHGELNVGYNKLNYYKKLE